MGFPVGYTELILPKLLLHTLSLLSLLRKLLSPLLFTSTTTTPTTTNSSPTTTTSCSYRSASSLLITQLLPLATFSDLPEPPTSDNCAVCLLEFEPHDEVRRLTNCGHVFHRGCIDRWIGYECNDQVMICGQRGTCPLCRTGLVPDDLQQSFNERLWDASGIHDDFYFCRDFDDCDL